MKYQLYTIDKRTKKGTVRRLYRTRNGIYMLSTKYISSFDYEKALELQNKYAEYNLEICDEDSQYFKFESRFDNWKRKLSEDDVLLFEKTETLQAACELCYSDDTLKCIINATTSSEITRAMLNARKSA